MGARIIILFLFISLLALAVADPLPRGSLSETEVLEQSRIYVEQHQYVAALKVLNLGLGYHPKSESITAEFQKDAELYIVHEISSGYQKINKNPHDIRAYIKVSNAFRMAGQQVKAMEVLTDGVVANPGSSILWRAIGNLEKKSGRPNEAASAFKEADRLQTRLFD